MITNDTFFFQDTKSLAHFRTLALPDLLAKRPPRATLRIWSAAAGTGQDAYSLAMILTECPRVFLNRSLEILGTDISHDHIAVAMSATYSQSDVQRGLSIQNLLKHFRKEGTSWCASCKLQEMIQFKVWDHFSDIRPLGQFDIVFYENILTIVDHPTKIRVLESIARQMHAEGFLYLGSTETLIGITDAFSAVDGEIGVFKRVFTKTATSSMSAPETADRAMPQAVN